ncbi:Hypothetical protein A7982_11012 [Minicystis rosea]|nr:Hypothetical protein A7982_11012 [Minicystis rosea]
MVIRVAIVLSLTLLVGCDGPRGAPAAIVLPASVRGHALELEIAADSEARARGLMFRRTLAENEGMLFVYPEPDPRSFWMRNTYVPLSIAFLDDGARIESILDLEPFDETPRRSAEPGRYAVEVPHGWFTAHGVGPGDGFSFTLPPGLTVR